MLTFNLPDCPLDGTVLIEASAGTGKTYSITGLFLRLLLERKVPAGRILIVTFTEAATGEIRDRVRKGLLDMKALLEKRSNNDTDPVDPVLKALADKAGDSREALQRVRLALYDFDALAIHTIHSFCLRMLHEFAFESGARYDSRLLSDWEAGALSLGTAQDFWRTRLYNAPPLFLRAFFLQEGILSPEMFLPYIQKHLLEPGLVILPDTASFRLADFDRILEAAFKTIADIWAVSRSVIVDYLSTSRELKHRSFSTSSVARWASGIDALTAARDPLVQDKKVRLALDKFAYANVLANRTPLLCDVQHPEFFRACESLLTAFDRALTGLKGEFIRFFREDSQKKKETLNAQYFDDLLTAMHRALVDTESGFSTFVRGQYQAALIDEFQDTDPVQFEIFRSIFAKVPDRSLFLIGDPKQAIFAFRGADIATYLSAAKQVGDNTSFTLTTNYRSQERLVAGVKALFSACSAPFLTERIALPEVGAAGKADKKEPLLLDGCPGAGLHLLYLQSDTDPDAFLSAPDARARIARAVAAEVGRLLGLSGQGRAFLNDQTLRPQDLAVLVRSHDEAALMKAALTDAGIPAVLYSSGNVFKTDECVEFTRLLKAAAFPGNWRAVIAACATRLLGMEAAELLHLQDGSTDRDGLLSRFQEYRALWDGSGFAAMFHRFLRDFSVRERLLALPDGERRITNLLHLFELAARAAQEQRLTPLGLLLWLQGEREKKSEKSEENLLRLEKDEDAVRILTMHKSKGLEFPVVFCPFTWSASSLRSRDMVAFHSETDGRLSIDLGSDEIDAHIRLAENDQLAENLRLLYVALTRAKNRCYLYWGRFNTAETSAPAYLLHHPTTFTPGRIVEELGVHMRALSSAQMLERLRGIAAGSNGAIVLDDAPLFSVAPWQAAHSTKARPPLPEFSAALPRDWRVTSFSSLTRTAAHFDTTLDDEGLPAPVTEEVQPSGFFAFPRGALPGKCLHEIFEHLDFHAPGQAAPLVRSTLDAYGFTNISEGPVCDMVERVLSVPLAPGLTLGQVNETDRLSELEFCFPLARLSRQRLAALFADAGVRDFPERIERLEFQPMRGYVRGFMDIVFTHNGKHYLLDWKSNHLGNSPGDYGQDEMRTEMLQSCYFLQYHLYVLALHRYLSVRLKDYDYERCFGGVYYIFLRGAGLGTPGNGIFYDRPSGQLVLELERALLP
ncbi:MAG: exodeoxyribonuclease V subunit beta [Fibrobacterota bacterium]